TGAVSFDSRQGVPAPDALVEGSEFRPQVARELPRDVVFQQLVDRFQLERRALSVVAKGHRPIAGGPLRVVSNVEPGAITTNRTAEIENRLPIADRVSRRREILGHVLIGRVETELRPERALQAI